MVKPGMRSYMIQHNTTIRYKENGPKESGHLSAATFKQKKSYVDDKCSSLYQTNGLSNSYT